MTIQAEIKPPQSGSIDDNNNYFNPVPLIKTAKREISETNVFDVRLSASSSSMQCISPSPSRGVIRSCRCTCVDALNITSFLIWEPLALSLRTEIASKSHKVLRTATVPESEVFGCVGTLWIGPKYDKGLLASTPSVINSSLSRSHFRNLSVPLRIQFYGKSRPFHDVSMWIEKLDKILV